MSLPRISLAVTFPHEASPPSIIPNVLSVFLNTDFWPSRNLVILGTLVRMPTAAGLDQ